MIVPFAPANLGDGDNNHLLCLNVPAGHLVTPNQDLNPHTSIALLP